MRTQYSLLSRISLSLFPSLSRSRSHPSLSLALALSGVVWTGVHAHLTDAQGLNAVHIAVVGRERAGQQYERILELLLERSQQLGLGLAKAPTMLGDMPLHFMAQMADESLYRPDTDPLLVRMLLAAGASLIAANAAGLTPQQVALQNGAVSLAGVLGNRGYPPPPPAHLTPTPSTGVNIPKTRSPASPALAPRSPMSAQRPPPSPMSAPRPPQSPALSARSASDSVLADDLVDKRLREGEGVPGALHEGVLHLLDKKIKDWVETYYAIVPMLTDKKGTGHGDFAYMLHSATSLKDAIAGKFIEKINLHGAVVSILQGTVFTIKTSPEVSKSRVFRMSADTLNDVRGWFLSFESVEGVGVMWENDKGESLSRDFDFTTET